MNSSRDAVAEAFDKLSAEASDAAIPDQPSGAELGNGGGEPAAPDAGAGGADAGSNDSAGSEARGPGDRARDAAGRFAPQKDTKAKPSPAAKGNPASRLTDAGAQAAAASGAPLAAVPAEVAPVAPLAPVLPDLKAPADWRPLAKEKWKLLPREVQEEALRTHTESRKLLSETAEDRKYRQTVQDKLAPYESVARSEGMDALGAADVLFRREIALRSAPPQMRAQILAHGIRTYLGTDENALNLLAQALNGQPAQAQPQQQHPVNVEAAVQQALEQRMGSAVALQAEQAVGVMEASGKHEFFDRVREPMAGLLEAGVASDLDDAYKKACSLDPEIAAVLKQRADGEAAKARAASTQQARSAAASGVRSEPAGPNVNPRPKNTRDAVSQAYDQLSGR